METFGKNPLTPEVYSTRYVLPIASQSKVKEKRKKEKV